MRKILTLLPEKTRYELSPLSYDEFLKFDKWFGGSDIAFASWKRHHGFSEIEDFREEVLEPGLYTITFEPGDTPLEFDVDGNSVWNRLEMPPVDVSSYNSVQLTQIISSLVTKHKSITFVGSTIEQAQKLREQLETKCQSNFKYDTCTNLEFLGKNHLTGVGLRGRSRMCVFYTDTISEVVESTSVKGMFNASLNSVLYEASKGGLSLKISDLFIKVATPEITCIT